MNRRWIGLCAAAGAALVLAALAGARPQAAPATLMPGTMPRIATVDARYQWYNVEMVEVVGGRFWKPYASSAAAPRPAPPATAGEPRQVGLDPNLFDSGPRSISRTPACARSPPRSAPPTSV